MCVCVCVCILYPFICQWTFGLFLYLGYCEDGNEYDSAHTALRSKGNKSTILRECVYISLPVYTFINVYIFPYSKVNSLQPRTYLSQPEHTFISGWQFLLPL